MSSLLDLFHRLITEHGSAEILEKHLGLIKDEFAQLERKAALLESQIIVLGQENAVLKQKKVDLEAQNAGLKERLDSLENIVHNTPPKMKWGCFVFPGDSRLYCPGCFYKTGRKIETVRVNSRNRFCPVCKTNLPSG